MLAMLESESHPHQRIDVDLAVRAIEIAADARQRRLADQTHLIGREYRYSQIDICERYAAVVHASEPENDIAAVTAIGLRSEEPGQGGHRQYDHRDHQ